MTETEEIPKDNMSQQAHKSGNATSINNKDSGNVAQPPNNSSLNSQISMIQLPADNSWAQKVMFILQQMLQQQQESNATSVKKWSASDIEYLDSNYKDKDWFYDNADNQEQNDKDTIFRSVEVFIKIIEVHSMNFGMEQTQQHLKTYFREIVKDWFINKLTDESHHYLCINAHLSIYFNKLWQCFALTQSDALWKVQQHTYTMHNTI